MVMMASEITTWAKLDYDKIVRGVVAQTGKDDMDAGAGDQGITSDAEYGEIYDVYFPLFLPALP
eukprot:8888630-Heterocapsa_arctica.AAC.1